MRETTELDSLRTMDAEAYETSSIRSDLRRDLHLYVDHIKNRSIRRSVRENKIPKADAKRIARLLGTPDAIEEIDETGESAWVDIVDETALALGFTRYDTKGIYQGYSSSSPSFSDNFIEFRKENYEQFLALPLQKQEQRLFTALAGKYSASDNEFCGTAIFGRLDGFSRIGYSGGVIPLIQFDKARMFLFDCLKSCKPGVWYETASLIHSLKKAHPFFLIPEKPAYRYQWEKEKGRYCNFFEYENPSSQGMWISEQEPDSFERVEGRFVERFLEHIPLMLGYVELAYDTPKKSERRPSLGKLKAFRVNEGFLRFMNGEISEPRVMVHPNHEIHVESDFYPGTMLEKLAPFSDLLTSDRICILKLNRMKTVNYLADEESPDVKKLLEELTRKPLPVNIAAELDEWAGHSETFLLYQDCGLLEGKDFPPFVKGFELEPLSATLRLVRTPDVLFSRLEKAEQVPVLVPHRDNAFVAPPKGATSLFTRKVEKAKNVSVKERMNITQKTYVTLFFETGAFLEAFEKALLEEKCVAEVNKAGRTITYAAEQKEQVNAAMVRLKKNYRVRIVRADA